MPVAALGGGWVQARKTTGRSASPIIFPEDLPSPGRLLPSGTKMALPRWHAWESGLGRTLLTHGPGAGSQALRGLSGFLGFPGGGGRQGRSLPGPGGGEDSGTISRVSLPLRDGCASHCPPSFGPLGKLMEPAFLCWGALSKYLMVGRLQGGTWVAWTLAEPRETRKRRGEGSRQPVSPQLSSTQFHPSPPSQLHFNPEGEWGPGDRAGGQQRTPLGATPACVCSCVPRAAVRSPHPCPGRPARPHGCSDENFWSF